MPNNQIRATMALLETYTFIEVVAMHCNTTNSSVVENCRDGPFPREIPKSQIANQGNIKIWANKTELW
jgi:hypothetical protein